MTRSQGVGWNVRVEGVCKREGMWKFELPYCDNHVWATGPIMQFYKASAMAVERDASRLADWADLVYMDIGIAG